MTWEGYFEYAGNEIINVARTEKYASSHGWFKPVFRNDVLGAMLGDRTYRSPLQDDAPWTDPDNIDSYDFLGVYPLDVTGIESSSRTSSITESLTDGGVPGSIRHTTKQVVFNTVLLADSEAGAEYGLGWLRRALLAGACEGNSDCFGAALCFLSSEPDVDLMRVPWGATEAGIVGGSAGGTGVVRYSGGDASGSGASDPDHLGDSVLVGGDASRTGGILTRTRSLFQVTTYDGDSPEECLTPYLRSLRNVAVNNGPTVTGKRKLSDGGVAWLVTFTAVAGHPHQVGPELEVIRGFLDPTVDVPWAHGQEPPGAAIDLNGFIVADETSCAVPSPTPLYDPLHPAIILPPSVPSVPLGNFTPPVNWRRRQFTIPKQYVPLWGEMVLKASIHAREAELRNLRLRFYADPFQVGDISDDPCAFCGDFIVSYVPQSYTMTLDGTEEAVYVTGPGGITQRADSLVFSSDGTPMQWPRLSCGFGYIVTLDLPEQDPAPVFDLSLFERIV